MRRLLILLLAAASLGANAQAYRWVDSSGHTIISDTPPPGKAKAVTQTNDTAEASANLSYATRKAMASFPVTLYTAPDCIDDCKRARDLLSGRGVPFTEKVVQKQEDFDELKKLVGDAFVPSIKVGGQFNRGFEAGAYNSLLDLAGYPKTAPYGSKPTGGSSK